MRVALFSLTFAWILALPFEGQILYRMLDAQGLPPDGMARLGICAQLCGLLAGGFLVRSEREVRRLFLWVLPCCLAATLVFFFPAPALWAWGVGLGSALSGAAVAACGHFFRRTPPEKRLALAADFLIFSNLLMTGVNLAAAWRGTDAALILLVLMLAAAFGLVCVHPLLPHGETPPPRRGVGREAVPPLAFLCLFVLCITIDSGLMYRVMIPAFSELGWISSGYFAVPYIVALIFVRNLPRGLNRPYLLYVGMAMIGFSFMGLLCLDRSVPAYLCVNTLMLGACGLYDLFWWSILGGMMELDASPASLLGVGLAANVGGVLLGGVVGDAVGAGDGTASLLVSFGVICVCLLLLPPLYRRLLRGISHRSGYLHMPDGPDGLYAMGGSAAGAGRPERVAGTDAPAPLPADLAAALTPAETNVLTALLTGASYRRMARDIGISENTVKTHARNIYGKLGVSNRTELMGLLLRRSGTDAGPAATTHSPDGPATETADP